MSLPCVHKWQSQRFNATYIQCVGQFLSLALWYVKSSLCSWVNVIWKYVWFRYVVSIWKVRDCLSSEFTASLFIIAKMCGRHLKGIIGLWLHVTRSYDWSRTGEGGVIPRATIKRRVHVPWEQVRRFHCLVNTHPYVYEYNYGQYKTESCISVWKHSVRPFVIWLLRGLSKK